MMLKLPKNILSKFFQAEEKKGVMRDVNILGKHEVIKYKLRKNLDKIFLGKTYRHEIHKYILR